MPTAGHDDVEIGGDLLPMVLVSVEEDATEEGRLMLRKFFLRSVLSILVDDADCMYPVGFERFDHLHHIFAKLKWRETADGLLWIISVEQTSGCLGSSMLCEADRA
jgi:hypothetical protein